MVKHPWAELWTNNRIWIGLAKCHKLRSEDTTLDGRYNLLSWTIHFWFIPVENCIQLGWHHLSFHWLLDQLPYRTCLIGPQIIEAHLQPSVLPGMNTTCLRKPKHISLQQPEWPSMPTSAIIGHQSEPPGFPSKPPTTIFLDPLVVDLALPDSLGCTPLNLATYLWRAINPCGTPPHIVNPTAWPWKWFVDGV